jgi:hypothetical protein
MIRSPYNTVVKCPTPRARICDQKRPCPHLCPSRGWWDMQLIGAYVYAPPPQTKNPYRTLPIHTRGEGRVRALEFNSGSPQNLTPYTYAYTVEVGGGGGGGDTGGRGLDPHLQGACSLQLATCRSAFLSHKNIGEGP